MTDLIDIENNELNTTSTYELASNWRGMKEVPPQEGGKKNQKKKIKKI